MADIFISYRDEDQTYRNDMAGIVGSNNYSDVPVIDRKDLRKTSSDEIREFLNSIMDGCSILILLVGENTHNGAWVLHEINVALSRKIYIIPVQIPESIGGLPQILMKKGYKIIEWDGSDILERINKIYGRKVV